MTVYLLHFSEPFKHAKHYTGYTDDLPRRMQEHRRGNSARLIQVIHAAGLTWQLARTWPGAPRKFERYLKDSYKNAPKLCPICYPKNFREGPANE